MNAPLGSASDYNFYDWYLYFNLPNDELAIFNGVSDPSKFVQTKLNTQTDVNTQLCQANWAKTSTIDWTVNLEEYFNTVDWDDSDDWENGNYDTLTYPLLRLQNSDNVVGIALNGVFFMSGTSHYGYDVFFPTKYGNMNNPKGYEFDVCLGNQATYQTYRYHSYSPCIYDISLRKTA